jgi:beta-mannosidase
LSERASGTAPARARVEGHEGVLLGDGWQAAACLPNAHGDPATIDELEWLPARVPGTAAGALREAGRWQPGSARDLDAEDWWFRARFDASPVAPGEEVSLELDGLATVTEVFLNGTKLLASESMFATHAIDVGELLEEENTLAIRCRALTPLLQERRKPRARWRTGLAAGNLRFFRTMLLGRAPGFAPGPAAVGPWRPVRLMRRRTIVVASLSLRTDLEDETPGSGGLLSAHAQLRSLGDEPIGAVELQLTGPSGAHSSELTLEREGNQVSAHGTLHVPDVARWWPHTHGEPALHEVRLRVSTPASTVTVEAGRTGFRTLSPGVGPDHEVQVDGLDLHVNGTRVFVRGALWTPADAVNLATEEAALRAVLERVRDAGMNMLRIPGTGAYESATFHDLCDELGILVWQDFMFANFDYPITDDVFRATVEREAQDVVSALAGRPSLAVLCGNSEIEQQVAMLGLDSQLGRGELFGELLPALVAAVAPGVTYLPSAPCGGVLPFRPNRGVANYYGVGGYRRPLCDAREADVRFAAECLAFANVPDQSALEDLAPTASAQVTVNDPRWKSGVPRDVGSGWDFDDVRDHYLRLLLGLDPTELRSIDEERYLELSRMISGHVMSEVFGEWRRVGSRCGGGLVLWLKDLVPGAGWGVLDHRGEPKLAYHHLRRALAPVAVWTTEEGLRGITVHVANDGPSPLSARVRLSCYRNFEQLVETASDEIQLAPHSGCELDAEGLLGRFVDISWAYRFGPPTLDLVVASLEREGEAGVELLSQSMRLPTPRLPLELLSAIDLGLEAWVDRSAGGDTWLHARTRRLVYGVRVHVPGFASADEGFSIEPNSERRVLLSPLGVDASPPSGSLSAINLRGQLPIALNEPADG